MSNFLSLNLKDFFKGFLMAILVPALLIVQQRLESGVLTFNWKQIAIASISGASQLDVVDANTVRFNNQINCKYIKIEVIP